MRPRNAACDFLPTLEMTLGPKERIARRPTKINRLLFFSSPVALASLLCLLLLLLLLLPSRRPFPSSSPPPSLPTLAVPCSAWPALVAVEGPSGAGGGLLAGGERRGPGHSLSANGSGVFKPLWGSAPHNWDGISLQPCVEHKISGRTNRIAQQAVGRGRNQS